MEIGVQIEGQWWDVDASTPIELAVPLDFRGPQPRAFSLPPARSHPVEADEFVGDTRRGGSANCETVEMTPHGNGTHTEGVGHLTEQRISVGHAVAQPLLPAALLTVPIRRLHKTDDTYDGVSRAGDLVICRAALQSAREHIDIDDAFFRSLIIRLQSPLEPRDDFSGTNPPYPTTEAIDWIRELNCDHLLVELPSIDRESDGGTLPNHHRFFGLQRGQPASENSRRRTVTELITVPGGTDDGPYALSLRFPRFELDAAPSRPIIYPLRRAES